jgi:hypothetical protein
MISKSKSQSVSMKVLCIGFRLKVKAFKMTLKVAMKNAKLGNSQEVISQWRCEDYKEERQKQAKLITINL